MKTLLSVIGGITLLIAAIFGIYMGYMAIWNAGYNTYRREVATQLADADAASKEAAKVKEAADKATAEAQSAEAEAKALTTQLGAEHAAFVSIVLAIRVLNDNPTTAVSTNWDGKCEARRDWMTKNAAFSDASVTVGNHGTFDFVRDRSGKVIDLKPAVASTPQELVQE